jgi:hypothetical protein
MAALLKLELNAEPPPLVLRRCGSVRRKDETFCPRCLENREQPEELTPSS